MTAEEMANVPAVEKLCTRGVPNGERSGRAIARDEQEQIYGGDG